MITTMNTILKESYMFNRLSEERLAEVLAGLESTTLAAKEVLFNMGDPGDELYIVETGRIAIYAPDEAHPGEEQPIRIFRSGGILGEMALIDNQPRSLSARTLETSRVLTLSGDQFRQLIREDPEMAFSVMYGLSDRIRYTTDFLNEVRAWVSRVTEGQYANESFIDDVRDWVQHVANGDFDEQEISAQKYRDKTLASLAAEFAHMAAKVQEREQELKLEIAQLKIEIDDTKRKEDVNEIMSSDYFQNLKSQIKSMRDEGDED